MDIRVNPGSKTAVYIQIAQQIKLMIMEGRLLDGFPLPSEREMAKLAGVHRNTVIKAYNELKADGLIQSQQGKGYRVTYAEENPGKTDSINTAKTEENMKSPGEKAKQRKGRRRKDVNWADVIKDEYLDMGKSFDMMFSRSYCENKISFAGGAASPDIYKENDIARGLSEILSGGKENASFYTPYQGDTGLRHQLSAFMRSKGVDVKESEIQVMSETNQALDFLFTLFLKPGDKVIIEEPVSPDVYKPIKLAGAQPISVPVDQNGMMCDRLEPLIEMHRPRFIYVNSSYHDPTGAILSLERRRKLLELSYKYRIPIIEDDAASEIGFEGDPLPSIKSLDKGGNVIYIYSFTLTFVPGIGMAFVAAPSRVAKSMSYLVSMRLINLDWIAQKMLARYLEKGIYQKRLGEFRREYCEKRDIMCRWLDKCAEFGLTYEKPRGGVYIWCRLPEDMNCSKLEELAAKEGIRFIPGKLFFSDGKKGKNYMRLNYSFPDIEQINEGMQVFLKVLKDYKRQ